MKDDERFPNYAPSAALEPKVRLRRCESFFSGIFTDSGERGGRKDIC
jgi:hypothetical protein